MARQNQHFANEAMKFVDTVANEAKAFVAESSEHQAAITQQRMNDLSNAHQARQAQDRQAYLDQMALERHSAAENERALARQREDAFRSEVAEQSKVIKELREKFEAA